MTVWKSEIDSTQVEGMSLQHLENLIKDLDLAVEQICKEYGVE